MMNARSLVWETTPIGMSDPWTAFLALDDGGPAVLLESARQDSRIGRYSIIGVRPCAVWQAHGRACEWREGAMCRRYLADPLPEWRRLMRARRVEGPPELPPFVGGALGYVSYEARHAFERLPQRAVDDLGLPHWYVLFCDDVLVFDHEKGTVTALCAAAQPTDRPDARKRAADLLRRMRGLPSRIPGPVSVSGPMRSSFSGDAGEAFAGAVRRVLDYIAAGDVYQVNLSQRLALGFRGDARTLYAALRRINPSPFAAFLRGDGFTFVGSSPERLVVLRGANAQTRPIAGTRPRGNTDAEDDLLRAELLLSPKERAEHIMLVDLERNDLGRVCRYGSVRVDELMVLERYSHVNHIVSNVVGELLPGKDALDLLAAMFPGGTITGCPKIRCMEIIDELEPVARHAYTGSIGYVSDGGDMDMNIVIRTVMIARGQAFVPVGAGIVADSEPDREYGETLQKAEALLRALAAASGTPRTAL